MAMGLSHPDPEGDGVGQPSLQATARPEPAPEASTGQPAHSRSLGARRTAAQVVLLIAFSLDMFLYSLVIPFLPGEAQQLGATPLGVGILFALYAAGIFAATPLGAWMTDRIGSRRTLLWGLIALAVSTLLFAFSPTLGLGLPGLFVARSAQGVASALTWTAGLAVLVQLYPAEHHSRLFARAFTATGLAALLGPPLGGALYALGGFMLPFLVGTGFVALDGLGRLLFLPNDQLLPATRPGQGATRALLGDATFRMGLFAAAAGALALSALEPVTPLLLGQTFGMPTWGIGVVFGGLALCFVLFQPVVVHLERRIGATLTIRLGFTLVALCFVGITLVGSARLGVLSRIAAIRGARDEAHIPLDPPVGLLLVLLLLAGVGCALALVLIPAPGMLTQRGQRLAGPGGVAYGAIYGAYNAAYAAGTLLGPLATGGAVAARGDVQGFLILALAPALSVLVLLFWRSRPADATDAGHSGNTGQANHANEEK